MTDKKMNHLPIFTEHQTTSAPTSRSVTPTASDVSNVNQDRNTIIDYAPSLADRDEDDQTKEVNRVQLGGIFIASPSLPRLNISAGGGGEVAPSTVNNSDDKCRPECKLERNERCEFIVNSQQQYRCVCRPGFARMFPDRPCKR